MLKKNLLIYVSCILYFGCAQQKTPESKGDAGQEVRVVKEFHPNGRLKSETQAVGNLRHGISREYRSDGTLENEIRYDQNRKHGLARNFYSDGKTVNTEINYENGYKQGESKWYYPGGEIYRVTTYKNNMIEGLRRYYYENGNIQAEIPYHADQPGTGLREYAQDGSPREFRGEIRVREEDRISLDNQYALILTISDGTRNVEFFTGNLTDGKYWNEELAPVPTDSGVGRIEMGIPKGTFKMETLNLVARIETNLGHTRILQREYYLAVENPF